MKLIAKLLALLFKKTVVPEDPNVARAQMQIAIEEARAFRKGKLSPKYLLKYAVIVLAVLFCTLFIVGMFFPNLVDISHPLETIERILSIAGGV